MKPMNVRGASSQTISILRIHAVGVLLALLAIAPVRGQVVINEIMADNSTTLANHAGNFSDWVELFNSGATTFNIGGYSLTDTPTNTTKFTFPLNTLMAPGEHLVVWCDTDTGPSEFHTGFSFKA